MPDNPKIDLAGNDEIRVMTTEVVTAYLGRNQLAARDLPGLIVEVFTTLSGLGGSAETEVKTDSDEADRGTVAEPVVETEAVAVPAAAPDDGEKAEKVEKPRPRPEPVVAADGSELMPAVHIDSSVTPDLIYCLENGKGFKTLKRHLWSSHGLTPNEYRKKWGLPKDYPMVAPNYSKRRAATAKKIGLGRGPRKG